MPTYACHDGKIFTAVVTAPNKTAAESMTGLTAVKSINQVPWAGWTIEGSEFRPPQPFPSWEWNGQEWIAPEPDPSDDKNFYFWDENFKSWRIVEQERPYPSWIVNIFSGCWMAPKDMPPNFDVVVDENGSTIIIPNNNEYMWNEDILDWEIV